MYSPVGLQAWEIVAFSGLCAMGFLTVATVISATFAVLLTREPFPEPVPAAVRPATATADTAQPAYAA